jgi:hypothetical protein
LLHRITFVSALCLALCLTWISGIAFAQQPATAPDGATRPGPEVPLFFRVDWKTVPGLPVEHPLDQKAVSTQNNNVDLKLYGPSGKDIQENGVPDSTSNPLHIWTGLCAQPCAMAVREKNNYVDLTGMAKIRWVTKVSGLHQVHPILKLADGTWLLGEHSDGSVFDYHTTDFTLSESRWIKMDMDKVVTRGRWLDKVDLSKVDEIGFTDLMPGSGHGDGGYTDLGWFEIYGKPVPRSGNSGK